MAETMGEMAGKPATASMATQADARGGEAAPLMITRPKTWLEKPELQRAREGETAVGSPYLMGEELWWRRASKAAEAKFPLVSPRYMGASLMKGKESKAADWDEPREWRLLTVLRSPLMEQLRERFDRIGIQEVELLLWLGAAEEVATREAQPLLGQRSPSPPIRVSPCQPKTLTAQVASPARQLQQALPGGTRWHQAHFPPPGPGWHLGYWPLLPYLMEPLPLKMVFNEDPNTLEIFLNHVLVHLDHYTLAYPTQRVMLNAVAANL